MKVENDYSIFAAVLFVSHFLVNFKNNAQDFLKNLFTNKNENTCGFDSENLSFNNKENKITKNQTNQEKCVCSYTGNEDFLDEINKIKREEDAQKTAVYLGVLFISLFIKTIKISPYLVITNFCLYLLSGYKFVAKIGRYFLVVFHTIYAFESCSFILSNFLLFPYLFATEIDVETAKKLTILIMYSLLLLHLYFKKVKEIYFRVCPTQVFFLAVFAYIYAINSELPEWYNKIISSKILKDSNFVEVQLIILTGLYFITLLLFYIKQCKNKRNNI